MLKQLILTLTVLTIINNSICAKQNFETEIDSNISPFSKDSTNNQTVNPQVSPYKKPSFLKNFVISNFGGNYFRTGQTAKGLVRLAFTVAAVALNVIVSSTCKEVSIDSGVSIIKPGKRLYVTANNLIQLAYIAFSIYEIIIVHQGKFKDGEGRIVAN